VEEGILEGSKTRKSSGGKPSKCPGDAGQRQQVKLAYLSRPWKRKEAGLQKSTFPKRTKPGWNCREREMDRKEGKERNAGGPSKEAGGTQGRVRKRGER